MISKEKRKKFKELLYNLNGRPGCAQLNCSSCPRRPLKKQLIVEHIFTLSYLFTKENIDIMKTEINISIMFLASNSMKQNLQKYLKPLSIILVVLIVIGGFIYIGSKLRTKEAEDQFQQVGPNRLTLEVDGYGFTVGDVVQTKTERPAIGDIIVYDPFKNKSMCLGMGPSMSLGKILGVPGETFSFQNGNLIIRAEIVKFDRDYSQQKAVFRDQKYENLVGKNISLQAGEYLIDRWVGLECFAGELDETGSSISYNRFTVNEEAISGVVEKKIGHDNQAEKEFKGRIY